ncbi:MAG: C1 family peptidase [Pirellulaceae bacterium]|nr:C1 family peptidase [Pirellulaceae bacterium]
MRVFLPRHLCWRPDLPDFRDLVPTSPEIRRLLPVTESTSAPVPEAADLRAYLLSYPTSSLSAACPSSIVCAKLVEYFNYRCLGRIEPLNARFVMHAVNTLAQGDRSQGDCSGIRTNLKAIRRFGISSLSSCECHCAVEEGEVEANAARQCGLHSSDEYRSLQYFRLGEPSSTSKPVESLKAWLASGFPIAFGFSVPSSLDYEGFIDFRPTYDSIQGGHAALMMGFDDKQLSASRGAFRIYCPWGDEWGDQGFGWLPYTFVEHRIAVDFWTIVKPDWVAGGDLFW